jgi:hypothetical protein
MAVSRGYRVTRIWRVLNFPAETDQLFRSYVKTMYGLKCLAGGWDKLCKGTSRDTDRQAALIRQYKERYDIDLTAMSNDYNPGMYYMAKRCLNSLWGKFGQKAKQTQTRLVTSEEELFELLDNSETSISSIQRLGDHAMQVTYTHTTEYLATHASGMTNIAVAAATTAWARLKLYSGLETVQEQVLYCDTDSIIYRWKPGLPRLNDGPNLGDWADEQGRDPIMTFVSTGPKSYGYRTREGKQCVKIKGFTLMGDAKTQLSMDTLARMVQEENAFRYGNADEKEALEGVVVSYPRSIKRHPLTHVMTSTTLTKQFQVTFNKRLILKVSEDDRCLDTWPVGYGGYMSQVELEEDVQADVTTCHPAK